ncbi:MAG: class B sortase [Oscillospiraceae bacterium]|nr:class B sortase [Oscillospiraceae bacterium]
MDLRNRDLEKSGEDFDANAQNRTQSGNSPLRESAGSSPRRAYNNRQVLRRSAGHAGVDADDDETEAMIDETKHFSDEMGKEKLDGAISEPETADSLNVSEAPSIRPEKKEEGRKSPNLSRTNGSRISGEAETLQSSKKQAGMNGEKPKKKKKKRSHYTFVDILKVFLPWRGDSVLESVRKIVFSTALVVVGVCSFLIGSYYIDLYKAKQEYNKIQQMLEESRGNRGFQTQETSEAEDPVTGDVFEYLEYNDVANRLLSQNPDLVGYITVPGTLVSYPVVQKKSKDIQVNMNDYYLYRTFHQEDSRSGCIFMDYRCHFDEVVEHRRIEDNSGNVFIYGHNMNNRTMFGSLRDYVNNPSFYKEHPIVQLSSCYKDYTYKIFAIIIVDGEDYDSEYAFDCWNTLEFPDEETFYWYVNEAKKRTLISNDIDVKYGDPILSLYTCNGLVPNAKLILMCREVRAGEDPYEGTENATLNKNVLYPKAYYDSGHPVNYDPNLFVPYGAES